jgi:hypothetical protein
VKVSCKDFNDGYICSCCYFNRSVCWVYTMYTDYLMKQENITNYICSVCSCLDVAFKEDTKQSIIRYCPELLDIYNTCELLI